MFSKCEEETNGNYVYEVYKMVCQQLVDAFGHICPIGNSSHKGAKLININHNWYIMILIIMFDHTEASIWCIFQGDSHIN